MGRYRRIISSELQYQGVRPLRLAWICYLAAFALLALRGKSRTIRRLGVLRLWPPRFFTPMDCCCEC